MGLLNDIKSLIRRSCGHSWGKGLAYCCQGLCCLSHTASAFKYFLPLGLRESLCREGYPVNLAGQKQEAEKRTCLRTLLVSESFWRVPGGGCFAAFVNCDCALATDVRS